MPELPEVQTVVSTLSPAVTWKRIDRVQVLRADVIHPANTPLPQLLQRQRVKSVTRRGKKIVFTLAGGNRFYIHLGMSGRLTLESQDSPLGPHTHLIVTIAGRHIHFRDPRRFGGVYWLGSESSHETNMGPEPLEITSSELAKRLARTKRPIKNSLLDQSVLAGLGNIYVDESLFDAGIHPLTLASALSLTQIRTLARSIRKILKRAITHRGSTLRDYRDADGNAGAFQHLHRVYQRTGEKCPKCKEKIEKIVLGGRSTHFCAGCQPRHDNQRQS